MELKRYNVQHFHPRYLDQQDINEPLTVISDFFSADWLPDHLQKLREWRRYVIEEGYYKDEHKRSPAGLLFTHRLNARLVEAVCLIGSSKRAMKLTAAVHINYEQRLQQEEQQWLHYPAYLSPAERINPYLAISNFFKVFTVERYLDLLYEWLETGLSNYSADEFLDTSDVIYFYENMQKLYEAVWIIKQREIEPTLKDSAKDGDEKASAEAKHSSTGLSLIRSNCSLNEDLTPAEQAGLDRLAGFILAEIDSAMMIIHLGTHPAPDTFYLLVIISGSDKTPEHAITDQIEKKCAALINVCAIVHKWEAFQKGIHEGHRFFCNALLDHKIVYRAPETALPEHKLLNAALVREQVEAIWNRWGDQGKAFLDTALGSMAGDNYNLAVFLMHQAVESTLYAIIRVTSGYRLPIHNLARQLRLSLLFTDDLTNVFDFTLTEDVQLFELLRSGYSAARYKDDFNADRETVEALSDKVRQVLTIAEVLYHRAVEQL